jgi:hypothetical protein
MAVLADLTLSSDTLCVPKIRFGSQTDFGGRLSDRELVHVVVPTSRRVSS